MIASFFGGSDRLDIVAAVCITAAYIAYRFTKKDTDG